MKTIQEMFLSNKAWSQEMRQRKTDFFSQQTAGERPDVLWIGCSDSRVSPEQITQTRSGELFIHRNVANLVDEGDTNFLAVAQYAIDVLQVPHVVLCGHYGCSGIAATLNGGPDGPMHDWLAHARSVQDAHHDELAHIEDNTDRINRLVELNVCEQLARLARLKIVRNAFARGQELTLHGWVYDLRNGLISELRTIDSLADADEAICPPNVISLDESVQRSAAAAG